MRGWRYYQLQLMNVYLHYREPADDNCCQGEKGAVLNSLFWLSNFSAPYLCALFLQ